MSGTTAIFVTPSTSLVLLKLSTPTVVYLDRLAAPNFSVTIRDTTGLSSLITNPVRISTLQGASFRGGGNLYTLSQPYGLVNLSLRNSSIWQLNHTSGQPTESSAADVGFLSTGIVYTGLLSTAQKRVSTLTVETFFTPNSISVTGPFIVTNLSTPGFVQIDQSLKVYGQALLRGSLFVSSSTQVTSSMSLKEFLPMGSTIHVSSGLGVGNSIFAGQEIFLQSTLRLRSTIQLQTLQTTLSTSAMESVVTDSLRVGGILSTLGSLFVAGRTDVSGSMFLQGALSTGGLVSAPSVSVGATATILGFVSATTMASFASSLTVGSTVTVKKQIQGLSTLGVGGSFFTSTVRALELSTLGSLSTSRLEILSSAFFTGTLSSAVFQSYDSLSVGGAFVTAATLSSLGQTRIGGSVGIFGSLTVDSFSTSRSVGIGDSLSVVRSLSTGSAILQGKTLVGTTLFASSVTTIEGDLVIRSTGTLTGTLVVLGGSEISSFLVQSFLLSNLQILQSTPDVSFQVSSLQVSSIRTEFTRVSTGSFTLSSLYASTFLTGTASAETAVFTSLQTNSLILGSVGGLDPASKPLAVFSTKTQFADGLSTLFIQADNVYAGLTQAALIGEVSYLSNVTAPFFAISGITMSLSTVSAESFTTSSFTASTFVASNYLNIQSSLTVPYLVFEGRGFAPRFDVHQMLSLSTTQLLVNRSLFFDRATNRIGLFTSNPQYDLDVSGLVFASNFFYSTINPISISSQGTYAFSTLMVSSIFARDLVRVDGYGLQVTSPLLTGSTAVTINQTQSSLSNLFGLYTALTQSTLLLNAGLHVYQTQRVGINTYDSDTGGFVRPTANLDVRTTARTQDLFVSTVGLVDAFQTATFLTPFLAINPVVRPAGHVFSTGYSRLTIDDLFTLQTANVLSNRWVGVRTAAPACPLDVRGSAFFSSVQATQSLRTDGIAIGSVEL